MKRTIVLWVLILMCLPAIGQQDGLYSMYRHNGLVLNPADAGTIDALSVTLIHKRQWVGFPGAPTGQAFSVHSPLGSSGLKDKIGLGFHATGDRYGPNQRNGVFGSGSYKFKIGTKLLSLGLRIGIQSYRFHWSQIEYYSGTDPLDGNKVGVSLPEFALGLRYYDDKFNAGFSIGELTQPALKLGALGVSYGNLYRTFMFTSGYNYSINEKLIITPSLLFKYVQNSPADFLLNLNFMMFNKFWMGLGARSDYEGASVMLGAYLNQNIKVGYSYESGAIAGNSLGGSNEIMFGFNVWEKKPAVILQFISEDGEILMTSKMSKENYFFFDDLPSETSFLFKLESEDPGLIEMMEEVQVRYKDDDGDEVILTIQKDADRLFRYTYLPIKEARKLYAIDGNKDTLAVALENSAGMFAFQYLPNDPSLVFVTGEEIDGEGMIILVAGKERSLDKGDGAFYKFHPLPQKQVLLHLIGNNGDTLGTGYLNSDGFFVFEQLPSKQEYIFLLESSNAEMIDEIQILSMDDKAKVITMSKGSDKYFRYNYLEQDSSILYLIGKNGDTISSTRRNLDGYFVFERLPSEETYVFMLEGEEVDYLDDLLILLNDMEGEEKIISAEKVQDNLFRYVLLPQSTMGAPDLLAFDEAPLILNKVDSSIIKTTSESLKFNTGEAIIRLNSYIYLEELSKILIENPSWRIILLGYTDNVGTDKFNLLLSKQRAETVKRALVKRNVPPTMVKIKYYGEKNPIASNDTEEGRQKNRRVEMKVVQVKIK